MSEPMTDKRLAEICDTTQRRDYQHTIVLGDCIEECPACAVEELLTEAKRARADAARCQATNESDLYGVIRCDKPRDHHDEHEAHTDEAYSRWIRTEMASVRRLSEAVGRAKRAERELAELRERIGKQREEWGVRTYDSDDDTEVMRTREQAEDLATAWRTEIPNSNPTVRVRTRCAPGPWRDVEDGERKAADGG